MCYTFFLARTRNVLDFQYRVSRSARRLDNDQKANPFSSRRGCYTIRSHSCEVICKAKIRSSSRVDFLPAVSLTVVHLWHGEVTNFFSLNTKRNSKKMLDSPGQWTPLVSIAHER